MKCPKHSDCKACYSEKFDCHYCFFCNEWLEERCTDEKCSYCPQRPEKPVSYKKLEGQLVERRWISLEQWR